MMRPVLISMLLPPLLGAVPLFAEEVDPERGEAQQQREGEAEERDRPLSRELGDRLRHWQEAPEEEEAPVTKEMNQLAQAGLRLGNQILDETGDEVYPFGLLYDDDSELHMIAYSGDPDQQPSVDQWTRELFVRIQRAVRDDRKMRAAVMVRMQHLEKDGQNMLGLWALVDHRQGQARRVFLPLAVSGEGAHKPGEPLYEAAEEYLFP